MSNEKNPTVEVDLAVSFDCPTCGMTTAGMYPSIVDEEILDATYNSDGCCEYGTEVRLYAKCSKCGQSVSLRRH